MRYLPLSPATGWAAAPAVVELPAHEVHVWRAGLDLEENQLDRFHKTLSTDEEARAARFHFEKDRNHYTAARGILRTLLGRYLGLEPAQIRFSYNAHGKPELASGSKSADLRFNVTHSRGMALFGFNLGRDLGIDLEFIRPGFATDEIAARFFAPAEVAALVSLAKGDRARAFFNCWTRKEAFVKARGAGLSLGLDQFAVSLAPGEIPALLHANDDAEAVSRWTLGELEVGEDFAAALAVAGKGWQLRCWGLSQA